MLTSSSGFAFNSFEVDSMGSSKMIGNFPAMIRENRQLVTDEPVEFEKYAVEVVQDFRKIADRFRGNLKNSTPQFNEGKPKDVNM
jgi:hypothetical protein